MVYAVESLTHSGERPMFKSRRSYPVVSTEISNGIKEKQDDHNGPV